MFPRWSITFAFAIAQGACHCLASDMLAGYREHGFHGKGPISGQQPLCQELIWLMGSLFERYHSVRQSTILFGFLMNHSIFV